LYPFERVAAWSRTSYAAFQALADGAEDTGVRMLPGTELLSVPTSDPWWRDAVPALTRVRSFAAPYADGWTFVAPIIEMPVYLRWLVSRIESLGGTLTRMALSALPDRAEVVVNATGLGARRTADDPSLVPVRGQVVYVEQVGLDRWWLDGSGPVYVVPRSRDIVVGGTDEEGEWDRRPDPDTAKVVLERAIELVPELARARVLGHKVGLRPVRPQVRLDVEHHPDDRRDRLVVHCYGHGGAGVTLSWGCADEVAGLVG